MLLRNCCYCCAMTAPHPLTMFTPRQVADLFHTDSEWWVKDGARKGKFPHVRGRKNSILFTASDVEAIIATRKQPAASSTRSAEHEAVTIPGLSRRSAARQRTR